MLAPMFNYKLRNCRNYASDNAWDLHEVALIAEVTDPQTIRKWKPIDLIPVLQKVYHVVLARLGRLRDIEIAYPQHAFRRDHQTNDIIFTL